MLHSNGIDVGMVTQAAVAFGPATKAGSNHYVTRAFGTEVACQRVTSLWDRLVQPMVPPFAAVAGDHQTARSP